MTVIIRLLDATQAQAALPDLCAILSDCVEGGASVGFMSPYPPQAALPFWQGVVEAVGEGAVLLLVAEIDGRAVGTVQVAIRQMPNQPHRGDVKKMLVHRDARGFGLARRLMAAAELEAARHGKTLLVLDTATGEAAEVIYQRFGWQVSGVVPDYALFPDGRYCDTTVMYKRIAQPA
jgi:GNAT superfamily N-acetyltransferase